LNRNARELDCHSLLCVCEIVISVWQISISDKTAGSRSSKIGEGNGVSPGVGLIDESKRNCVHGPHKRIFTIGPQVPRIFMQGNTCQKARRSPGGGHGDGISIEPTERPSPILPVTRIVISWIRHAHTGCERRKDNRRRAKCLVGVDCEFIAEGQMLRSLDRQEEYRAALILRLER